VKCIDFKTSRNDMVSKKERAVQLFSDISDDFGRQTNVILVVEGSDLERMKSFIEERKSGYDFHGAMERAYGSTTRSIVA
jgi:predicted RND superfamily exporter protein